MIKIETNRGDIKIFELQGDVFDIVADMAVVIRAIHHVLAKNDEDIADVFKTCMTGVINDEEHMFEPFEELENEGQQ